MSKEFYRGKLPHLIPKRGTYFVTFRLHNSVSKNEFLNIEAKYFDLSLALISKHKEPYLSNFLDDLNWKKFIEIENILDKKINEFYLTEEMQKIVISTVAKYNGKYYDLLACCVMSNHVHVVLDFSIQNDDENYTSLPKVMMYIKGSTARFCNMLQEKTGNFWEEESYDMLIRNDQMLLNIVGYIANNPVKAGIVTQWDSHKFTFIKGGYN